MYMQCTFEMERFHGSVFWCNISVFRAHATCIRFGLKICSETEYIRVQAKTRIQRFNKIHQIYNCTLNQTKCDQNINIANVVVFAYITVFRDSGLKGIRRIPQWINKGIEKNKLMIRLVFFLSVFFTMRMRCGSTHCGRELTQ